ncbi:DNA-binding protein [Melanomma pulvis-pyrius CBS 109.77]|uniref:DNA-binding protein n=1 Tax=Melanomma pulvis-pyrius CBS 109.77 TaxID=1314802 RepID=A0A6A6WQR4_9PLEO|nr:DNA-binding protein [Melanomma pulvis-pyrius CBS 109.77]
MPQTYLTTLTHFTHFLTAYIHTLLYLRSLYPRASFVTSRFHNTPVHQSRHPAVCDWIRDAVSAVRDELLSSSVSRIAIVIFSTDTGGKATGSTKIMERFMLDVSQFPVVEKGERNTEIEWEEGVDAEDGREKEKEKEKAPDADVDVNLSESFRAALITLTTRCSQLSPLPPNCSFNISMELKDEADIDPPIGHPRPWIPVQPSLQKTGRKGGVEKRDDEERTQGEDLGGLRVTPIRTVEAGVFRFETWVEEGRAKFELGTAKSSLASSGLGG